MVATQRLRFKVNSQRVLAGTGLALLASIAILAVAVYAPSWAGNSNDDDRLQIVLGGAGLEVARFDSLHEAYAYADVVVVGRIHHLGDARSLRVLTNDPDAPARPDGFLQGFIEVEEVLKGPGDVEPVIEFMASGTSAMQELDDVFVARRGIYFLTSKTGEARQRGVDPFPEEDGYYRASSSQSILLEDNDGLAYPAYREEHEENPFPGNVENRRFEELVAELRETNSE